MSSSPPPRGPLKGMANMPGREDQSRYRGPSNPSVMLRGSCLSRNVPKIRSHNDNRLA